LYIRTVAKSLPYVVSGFSRTSSHS